MPPIVVGGLYFVADRDIRLLPAESRQVHDERRRVAVLSGSTNSESAWPFVLGCPVSGSTTLKTRFDVQLQSGEAGCIKKCWIRVPALQPFMKSQLEDLTGQLTQSRLEELQVSPPPEN
jgi:hypothetical protein